MIEINLCDINLGGQGGQGGGDVIHEEVVAAAMSEAFDMIASKANAADVSTGLAAKANASDVSTNYVHKNVYEEAQEVTSNAINALIRDKVSTAVGAKL